ncbi:methyltransferase domain-containing protein [Polyangium jinanense]|uniref:Methyltransferase domain-containing protein n=1 Tax=Polyangium jinanense TaxID=2829994 RepID=A0A9X3X5A3_9BACT|nr:methyltransferase domain-containing protein [Polyangium jinanense]MDC3959957.1 methyltransferase domain-containing protein [Polyangium jinanense]MDC3983837.1 methyltransferase domain-containing protein [Polyangium jinanense]
MTYEAKVREFYDTALHCYEQFMGDRWHHGDPEAEASGVSPRRACEILEEQIVSLVGLEEGRWALDFGSGIGGPTLHMAKVSSASFVGITNNERLNQRARDKAAELGLAAKARFITVGDTDYKNLPFPDNTFDAATFYESVCHIPDKPALFRELCRILKPGGRLGGMDWLQRPFGDHQTEEQIMQFMRPLNDSTAIPGHGTVESYKKMMEAAGLEVTMARDMYEGVKSRGSATPAEQAQWLHYEGPEGEMFQKGKKALDDARSAGVFTVGMFAAVKPR